MLQVPDDDAADLPSYVQSDHVGQPRPLEPFPAARAADLVRWRNEAERLRRDFAVWAAELAKEKNEHANSKARAELAEMDVKRL